VKQVLAQIAAEAQSLRRLALFLRALEMIRGDFEPQTWQAFWRVRVDGQPPVTVATEIGMTAKAVRAAKGRVLRRLREELDHLMD
jgi:RNA polymerase sigma-70 factor (ECF subfamily)